MIHFDPRWPQAGVFYRSSVDPREETMSDQPTTSTPEPVLKAAASFGAIASVVIAVLGSAVALGVLSGEQSDAVTGLVDYVSDNIVPMGTAIVGVVGVVSGLVSSLVTAFHARKEVVPINSDAYVVTKAATPTFEG